MSKKYIIIILFFITSTSYLFGHSGRTDSGGGHNDRINGGYHYHHGRGPHQHSGGKCPYEDGSSNTIWYVIGGIALIGGIIMI